MVIEPALAEIYSFLGAVLLAAIVSATARGLGGGEERPLEAFRRFYVDLSGAFAGLAVLSIDGPTPWATSSRLAGVGGSRGLLPLLPVAVGLLLIALLIARQRWASRTLKADILVTFAIAIVIAGAVVILTSRPTAAESFDRAAQRAISSYCSKKDGKLAEIVEFARPLLEERAQRSRRDGIGSQEAREGAEAVRLPRFPGDLAVMGVASPQGQTYLTSGISRRTRKKVRGEFCDALVIYLAYREVQE